MLAQTRALLDESHNNIDVAINTALDRRALARDEETEDLYVNVYFELMQLSRARAQFSGGTPVVLITPDRERGLTGIITTEPVVADGEEVAGVLLDGRTVPLFYPTAMLREDR